MTLSLRQCSIQHVYMLLRVNIVCGNNHYAIVLRCGKPFPNMFLAAAHMLRGDVRPNKEESMVREAEYEE